MPDSPGRSAAPTLHTEFAFTVRARLAAPVVLGEGPEGLRRFIPILGGTAEGPLLTATVLAGSGDWQVVRRDGVLLLEARYTLEHADGLRIGVLNRGLRLASEEVMDRLTRGESVPPDSYYFRTCALFEAPVGSRHDWLNRALFVGRAERGPDTAIIHFFRVN